MDNPEIVLYAGFDSQEILRISQALDCENPGFQVLAASSQQELIGSLRHQPCACILSECHLPGLQPSELLHIVSGRNPVIPTLFLLEPDEEERALDLIRWGAVGYVLKTPQYVKRLPHAVTKACEQQHLQTSHKRVVRELQQLSMAVDQSAAVILITDREGRIVFVNRAFETSTGYNRQEIIGQNPRVLKSAFLPPAVYQQLWATISHGDVWQGEFLNQRKDGSTYWEEAIITPIMDADGQITQYIAVKEDVTPRKLTEEALKKAKEEAVAANRLKNEFLANISHEIRTPMNAILGFADLLGEHETDPAKQKQLVIIQESGQQLLKIINDVLDFAKLESGSVEIQVATFAFRDMLHDLYQRFLPQVQHQQLRFTLDIADSVPPFGHGDEGRILQLLGNVVHNAIKFTRKGSVSIRCSYEQPRVCFCVTDSGIGIPEDKVARMLAPFEQVDTSSTRHHGGAGLGLAITQKLVRLMDGTLSLESRFGHGTTVTIELPVSVKASAEKHTPG